MRKMTEQDVKAIVKILTNWKRPPMRWSSLQSQISKTVLDGNPSWSRQSLQASEAINTAWLDAKIRLSAYRKSRVSPDAEPSEYETLEAAYQALEVKYNNLALRHRQLIHNASLLPGGTRLFLDPLPDNTLAQTSGVGPRKSRNK